MLIVSIYLPIRLVSLIPVNYRDTDIQKIEIDFATLNSQLAECHITCINGDYCLPVHHVESILVVNMNFITRVHL